MTKRAGEGAIARTTKRGGAVAAIPLLLALLAGCATSPHPQICPQGQTRATTAELVFGRNVGPALAVSDQDWRRFIDEDVTPRFPDGFSVIDGQGQWRGSNGAIVHEPSKVLFLVLDGGPDDPAKIAGIRDAYKRRFHQESVLLVTHAGCASY
jgi:hypothetical protein